MITVGGCCGRMASRGNMLSDRKGMGVGKNGEWCERPVIYIR